MQVYKKLITMQSRGQQAKDARVADFTNLEPVVNVSPIPTSRINSIHPSTLILGDPQSAVQTSKVTKSSRAHAFDKYVAEILKKFDFVSVKTASTPIKTQKPLVKDEPDIMFAVCACSSLVLVSRDFSRSKPKTSYQVLLRKSLEWCVNFFQENLLLSMQKADQLNEATSTTEAEYVATANCCGQLLDVCNSKIINNVRYITAKVAGKPVSISEASIRSDLLFDDANGIDSLPNQAIFDAIQLMGYEGDLTVLTFNKAFKANVEPQTDLSPRPSPSTHILDSIPKSSGGNHREGTADGQRLVTEDALSTAQQKVSTDKEKVSTDRPNVSTDTPNVSTDRPKVNTDKEKDSTVSPDEDGKKVQEDWESKEVRVKNKRRRSIKTYHLQMSMILSKQELKLIDYQALRIQDEREIVLLWTKSKVPSCTIASSKKKEGSCRQQSLLQSEINLLQELNLYEKKKVLMKVHCCCSTEDERRIKEINEGVKDPDQKSLKKRVVEETSKKEDTTKVPAKVDVTEQGTKKRKGGHMKMIARKRKRPQPDVNRKRRYPLSKDLLQRMLDLGLEVERESTDALDLIRFIKQQIDEKIDEYLEIKPLVSSEHINEFNLINEASLSEYDEEIVSRFNVLFNIVHLDDSQLEKENDDNDIGIIQSSEDMAQLLVADQRHPLLRNQIEEYNEGIRHSYEQSLRTI
ncbi:hypothetical protein Tco_0013890 [Tanacetum coccineum]